MTISCRIGTICAFGAILAACGDRQSVLNPKSPEALQLAQLSWFLFVAGAAILALVVLATAVAIHGPDRTRALLASSRTVIWAGVVFPVITLTLLLSYGVWMTRANAVAPDVPNALRVTVIGEQWWWRVRYQHSGVMVETANEIRIPAGRPVVFTLASADVIHSFWVPNLGGKLDMIPGRTTHLRLRADQPGVFRGQCAEYCGGPHALMAFEVVALSAPDFEAWLAGQAKPAAEPVSAQARRGRDLFLSAGCGGCHAVRGTQASGKVGPDLTHLASRRSVGLDTLPMTEANIQRFIHDGQHLKPGNLMPPFRIFPPADLDAIAVYLAGLR
jgi:cytochrome c oxidase subunit II